MTIDVEDYFQVSALAPYISRDSWPEQDCRVERNIDRILALLDAEQVKATFFTLGWIAERYPAMIKKIHACGHEIASHGYEHLRVTDQNEAEFAEDISRSKHILEELTATPVLGYRAPSFSIGRQSMWALDTLQKAGYKYSSSIYPIQHDHYGISDAPRFPYYPNGTNGLLEIPISTIRALGKNYPAGGGGYFRLFPYFLSRFLINRVNQVDQQPGIFYFHPWEIDPGQPVQQSLDLKTRFRHYVNLSKNEAKLKQLITDFDWGRMDDIFLNAASQPRVNA
ncbi:XrtA system polysaccharide deacetylase [Undibacterium sp. SXout20W]